MIRGHHERRDPRVERRRVVEPGAHVPGGCCLLDPMSPRPGAVRTAHDREIRIASIRAVVQSLQFPMPK